MRTWASSRPDAGEYAGRRRARCRLHLAVAAALALAAANSGWCGSINWEQVRKDGTALLSDYIKIDTTNPPGNEIAAANFLAARFRREGIETKVFESDAGRASVLARLPGRGRHRPIVLLSHLDVVLAQPPGWTHPPFSGAVADGYVYGRGAIDCKGTGTIAAMALIALKRAGEAPGRDVIFLATADEETGGQRGAGWFAANHLAELGNPEFVLNEGGHIRERQDGSRVFEVAAAEKTPLWLRMTATGEPGHGSTPRGPSAVTRLIRALDRIRTFEPAVKVVPEVQAYYRALADTVAGEKRARYRNLASSLAQAQFRHAFLRAPRDAALVRNTIAPTVLSAGTKTNVIPSTASAELDCRLLPGEDPDDFLSALKAAVDDDGIEFTVLLHFPPSSSPTDTSLYRAIREVAAAEGHPVVPSVLRGFTDSHYFREHGIVSYGFVPIVLRAGEAHRVHGLNERLAVENIGAGTRRLVAILRALDE